MITHIRMKNFKSWKDSGEVKLAPLTGFFGTNSSGKSSLLQMLLLLKQTVEQVDSDEVIFFGDETSYANLGNFKEVIHSHESEEKLYFEISAELRMLNPDKAWSLIQVSKFVYDTVIRQEEGNLLVDSFQYRSLFNNRRFSCNNEQLSNNQENTSKMKFYNCYSLSSSTDIDVPETLTLFISAFEDLFSHVFYLGPIRAHPQRKYHWDGSHPIDIGKFGDKTIDALLSARIDRKTIKYEEEEKSIEERISDWLREMNLAYTFSLERIDSNDGKDYEVRIQYKENGTNIALADMGYGLSQFLPVLVLCYYAPEGSTLILEQPGIHLHPKVQSQLADLFIEVITERKLQILVESHSEHLLTRIQRRIVEKQIEPNAVALYFCRNEEGASTIDKLDVDEDSGDIKNWPENFFGNVMGDMFAMTDKQVENIAESEPEN